MNAGSSVHWIAMVSMLSMLLGGGPTDLLDLISSSAYWKAKNVTVSVETLLPEIAPQGPAPDISALLKELGATEIAQREAAQKKIEALGAAAIPQLQAAGTSPDLEVATRSKALIEKLNQAAHPRQVRRLMAIRTLGELKNKAALPTLQPLLQSKQMFEADYAAAAVAAIEGKPYSRPHATAAIRAKDLGLMPANLGVVAQIALPSAGAAPDLDKKFEMMAPMTGQTKEDIAAQWFAQMLQMAEALGNARYDGATIGVTENIGNHGGFIVLIARGTYDRKAMADFVSKEGRAEVKPREEQGVQIVEMDRDNTLLMPSDELLVVAGGAEQENLPIADLVAALTSGKGKMALNAALGAIIQTIDTTKPLWAAMAVNDNFRAAPPLAPFDSLTLVAEPKGPTLEFNIKAVGGDKDKAAAVVMMVNAGVQAGLMMIKQQAQQAPNMAAMTKDLIDTMASIKASADGGNAMLTGTLKSGPGMVMMMPMMMMGRHEAVPVQAAPPQVQPEAPVEKLDPAPAQP